MNRRKKMINPQSERVDRISHVPDDVLVHILSLLETKDVVRTTVLSREWRQRCMWVHVYNLSFDITSVNVASEIRYVNRTLLLHRAPKIIRFSLHIQNGECQKQMLAPWLCFAMMRHVDVLNLYLPSNPPMTSIRELPELLFSHGSLRELTTKGWDLWYHRRADWGSLRVLDVGCAYLVGFWNLLSGCPSLEYLRLHNVYAFCDEKIDITQKKLKKLVIEQLHGVHDNIWDPEVRVAAPQLEELEILGCWRSITCKLVDVPSLVDVRLDFYFLTWAENDERCKNAEKELREKVEQIMG